MTRHRTPVLVATACLFAASCSTEPVPLRQLTDPTAPTGAAPPNTPSPSPLDGLWSGSWGGGDQSGVVMQPVLAELLIDGDHVELAGFPAVGGLRGTHRIDAARPLVRESTPVVIAFRQESASAEDGSFALLTELGHAQPDSSAVRQTLSQTLRPGTLVLILSTSDNVPLP